jgi:RAB protein geranylgeranyltransferase component A
MLKSAVGDSALAKSGRTVLHVDEQAYYGSSEAILSLKEVIEWASSNSSSEQYSNIELSYPSFSSTTPPEDLLRSARQYNLSLCPTLVTAVSPFVDTLVRSGVAKYTGFKLLDAVAIHNTETFKRTAATKEDIFNDKSLGLLDKRKLVNFIKFATSDFETSDQLQGEF